jgi:hypothetical protein
VNYAPGICEVTFGVRQGLKLQLANDWVRRHVFFAGENLGLGKQGSGIKGG